jgi:hypothetical protein
VCHPKHVEQLRNIGIINSTTQLHLVGSFYEMHSHFQIAYKFPLPHAMKFDLINDAKIITAHLQAI